MENVYTFVNSLCYHIYIYQHIGLRNLTSSLKTHNRSRITPNLCNGRFYATSPSAIATKASPRKANKGPCALGKERETPSLAAHAEELPQTAAAGLGTDIELSGCGISDDASLAPHTDEHPQTAAAGLGIDIESSGCTNPDDASLAAHTDEHPQTAAAVPGSDFESSGCANPDDPTPSESPIDTGSTTDSSFATPPEEGNHEFAGIDTTVECLAETMPVPVPAPAGSPPASSLTAPSCSGCSRATSQTMEESEVGCPEENTYRRRTRRWPTPSVALNSMAATLSHSSLLCFAADFGLSGALLSALEVGEIFLSCDGGEYL